MSIPAYYNTALAAEAVPFRSTDDSFIAETARDFMDVPIKFLGLQLTGGSSSVPDSYVKLRHAGAVAREMLKAAAAQQSGVPVDQLSTADGAVHLPDGSSISYVDLAPIAATIDPVNDVTLRAPSEWHLIGKSMQRIDIIAKSTGTQVYGVDQKQPGMVHAAIRAQSPARGGEWL